MTFFGWLVPVAFSVIKPMEVAAFMLAQMIVKKEKFIGHILIHK
jgi:hypothetical protein